MAEQKRTFEQSASDLEAIVRQLEGGSLQLDDSLKAFERGIGLTRECELLLNEAKAKVEKLVRDAAGEMKTEPFEPKG
ncbi:MAG: exodeoxyribonuclease VII small subunit [Pseudomonadota bacterium]